MPKNSPLNVLVVDDNRSAADGLAMVLEKLGDNVTAAYGGREAIQHIQTHRPDVVLTDLRMEPVDGMAVLRAARELRPPVECIVLTAYGAVETAVHAIKLGARDFLTKPVAVEQVRARLDALRAPEQHEDHQPPDTFIAHAASSQALLQSLQQAASVPVRVWIEGEIGSGRVHSARTLHELQEDVSSLTILDPARLDEWPDSGTVILPSVDDLPDDLQSNLKRRLALVPEGVRIISTASPESALRVSNGELRADLYYDLAVVTIAVPSLSARREDVIPIFHEALKTLARRYSRPEPELTKEFKQSLQSYRWPGNVRELLNMAERMVVLGFGEIPATLPERGESGLPNLEDGFNLAKYMEDTERRVLVAALRQCQGDRNAVGRLLEVERNTLRYKLNKFGLLDK